MKAIAKIKALKEEKSYPKYLKIVDGINAAIADNEFKKGDLLPSVNGLSAELGVARETVVTAYKNLKDRGIISSRHGIGFYVDNTNTKQKLKVALVLYAFHSFQEIFYNTFREALGEDVKIEVFFHHNNNKQFEQIISSITGKYGMYVVAPIHHKITQQVLLNIAPNKLLIIDRFEELGKHYSYIAQEFYDTTLNVFEQLLNELKSYKKIVLFYRKDTDYPKGIKKAFQHFIKKHRIEGQIEKQYETHLLQKNCAYITIGNVDLWKLLKDAQRQNIEAGKDIGILSANDSPVKEIISGGITTFFADFDYMAKKAANYVLHKKPIKEILKVELVK